MEVMMKKKIFVILSLVMLISALSPAMASFESACDSDKDIPVYYIDVSPEEWEQTFMEHPYFKEYDPNKKAIFRLPEENMTRAYCYNCGNYSVTLRQEWRDIENMARQCPGMGWGSDNRIGFHWVYGEYCYYCGLLGQLHWNQDRYSWSWIMLCHLDGEEYPIHVGASIDDGYDVHNCYSIVKTDNGIVHGLNCNCH